MGGDVVVDEGGVGADFPEGLEGSEVFEECGFSDVETHIGQKMGIFGLLVEEDTDAGGVQESSSDFVLGTAVVGLGL